MPVEIHSLPVILTGKNRHEMMMPTLHYNGIVSKDESTLLAWQ